jgi:xanthine dehydrogenase accessory factor
MSETMLELAYKLMRDGQAFVLATVVDCERPTSAKPGAQAIIQRDGQISGWIGGNCTQPIVRREALRLLQEGGEPYVLHLGALPENAGAQRRYVHSFPMTCSSGGALDIYMEPHLPPPHLVLIGDSPVIQALSQLAPVVNFRITQINHADLSQAQVNEQTSILIATHGQYDEDALEWALPSVAPYVGMVGSHRRVEHCRKYLRESGLSEEQIARLKAPAGLDIGASTPEEIASSILAELVQIRRRGSSDARRPSETIEVPSSVRSEDAEQTDMQTARDPVCGMEVEIPGARHHLTHEGHEFYFCCPACKRLFEQNPHKYLVPNERVDVL